MRTLRMLIIAAVIAMAAAPAMAAGVLSTTLNFGTWTIPVTMDIVPWVTVSDGVIKLTQVGSSTTWQGGTTVIVTHNFPDLDIDATIAPAGIGANVGETYTVALDGGPFGPTAHTTLLSPHLFGAGYLLEVDAQIQGVNPAARPIGTDQLVANVVLTLSQTTP